jgi:dihydroorotase
LQHLLIDRPDDWHLHLRDQIILQHTVPASAQHFGRALIMPNLTEALTTIKSVTAYRERILEHIPKDSNFVPYMTLYLNDTVIPDVFFNLPYYILGAKLYPAGSTTFSDQGVESIQDLYPVFDAMQTNDVVLQIHGEVTYDDIFDREKLFIHTHLCQIMRDFPKLRIVLEHISTRAAVDFVTQAPQTLAATITPHHLLYNRNQLLVGGIKPHYYCLPILKHAEDQKALQQAAISGNRKFFAGTDSAPHAQSSKESACGCAGIYSAPYAISLYAQCFEELNALKKLNAFMGTFGAEFYQLSKNKDQIELIRQQLYVPQDLPLGQQRVIPMAAGETLNWSVYAAN